MKQNFLRRFGALVLSLAMALSLVVTPAWAAPGDADQGGEGGTNIDIKSTVNAADGRFENTTDTLYIKPNTSANLKIEFAGQDWILGTGTLHWASTDNKITFTINDSDNSFETVMSTSGELGNYVVTATLTNKTDATDVVTDTLNVVVTNDVYPQNVPVTGVSLNNTAMSLQVGDTGTLQADVAPANATNRDVTWKSSDETVATVTPGANRDATVTALKEGSATITVTTADGNKTAACVVTVTKKIVSATGLEFIFGDSAQMNKSDGDTKEYTAKLTPEGATLDDVKWESSDTSVATVKHVETNAAGVRGLVTRGTQAGKTTIKVTATSGGQTFSDSFTLTVSGITLSRTTLSLAMGKTLNLGTPTFFGEAVGQRVTWTSENPAIASVSAGTVNARNQTGTAKITATTDNGYSASCVVTVSEDTMGLIQTGTVAAGTAMNLANTSASTVFDVNNPDQPQFSGSIVSILNSLVRYKHNSSLSYVSNLSVSTAQGVLYYSYVSEADPGAGVGSTESYYVSGAQGLLALNQVSFVPRAGFTGSADISYIAWTVDNKSVTGTIRVPVSGSGGSASGGISYTAKAGEPARFNSSDFDAVCRARTGRSLSYVTFYLPSESYGTLYYNYTGGYGERVKSTTQYRLSGSERLDNVSFVPAAGYSGPVAVSYRGVSTGGTAFSGQITIDVTPQAGYGSVNYTGTKKTPVYFQANDFNLACYNATNQPLNYVRFTLPSSSQGTLYYNYYNGSYNNPVSAATNYYRSGTPGVGNVCFVPASTVGDTVSIPFTGIGTGGASFAGTVFIRLDGTGAVQNIQYTAYKGKPVLFQTNDFNNACVAATGTALNYVQFQLPASTQGTLYYNYRDSGNYGSRVYAGTSYYRTGYQNLVGNISFVANSSYSGSSRFNYTGYAANGQSFTGTVTVQVSDPVPNDVNYTTSSSSPIRLNVNTMRNACSPVLSRELSYIEITGLPAATSGQLYANYSGFGTGTLVSVGARYYCSGSPSIDQLYFVPRGRVQGTATVTYNGYSVTGERVSGRINFNLSSSGTSRYFTDMGKHSWAAAAVDYLYENEVTNGVASGQYGPNQKMLRRDFVLMLCRAFGFTGGSGYSFADVPTNAYYANAVATAKRMGIVQGDGRNFMPNSSLTRQDAMVMIKNALTAAGWSLGDGSSVDLSRFVDNREVSNYARDAVGTLVRLGAVNGDERSRLNPRSDITRAEIAVILHFVMTM